MANNVSLDNVIFFENATSIGYKDYLISKNASQMMLKIETTGTFIIKLMADISPKSETLFPFSCYQVPSGDEFTTITDANYLYALDLISIDYLRVELISVTGSVNCYAKVVG